ncbi:MAG TPA: hypothetical protein DFR83_14290, partial [Deltaproteobacteria bacterium]|nr:hypothetical protein [Deltaproteobacteria bacterium]
HLGCGPTLQALVAEQTFLAPGPWVRVTVHPRAPLVRSKGILDDFRNAEWATEVRGAWWTALPGRPLTGSTRTVVTVGSSRLRYGVLAEVPLHRPVPSHGPRWLAGGRIEVRPKPTRRSTGWAGSRSGS